MSKRSIYRLFGFSGDLLIRSNQSINTSLFPVCSTDRAMRGISSEILREVWLEIENKGEHITTKTCEKGADTLQDVAKRP